MWFVARDLAFGPDAHPDVEPPESISRPEAGQRKRALTVRTVDGGTMPGATLIDRFWKGVLNWATVEQPRLAAERLHQAIREQILASPKGETLLREFNVLADAGYDLAA